MPVTGDRTPRITRPWRFELAWALATALVDGLLARRFQRFGEWRAARVRRRRARPAWLAVTRQVVGVVLLRFWLHRLLRTEGGEFTHPDEARRLFRERTEALCGRSYEDLAAQIPPGRRRLGILVGDSHEEHEEIRGESETRYDWMVRWSNTETGHIQVFASVGEVGNSGFIHEQFRVAPDPDD